MAHGLIGPRGTLSARKIRPAGPGWRWKLANNARWRFVKGWLAAHLIAPFANWWGVTTLLAQLEIRLFRADGSVVDYGVVSYRLITDAGVAFLVDDWDGSVTDLTNMKYHGLGTGTNAENATDTALQTESTTALNPDSTRATGTQSQPAANQFRTVGTLTFDASAAITEHGVLSQSATGGGTLWDRSVFSAINVVSADSIQTTYTCTVSSGG